VFLNVFKKKHKHSFIITNTFYTLEDQNQVDVVKSCMGCSAKEAFSVDRVTLMELVEKFPKAFNDILLEYLKSWKS
jgi:phage gp16-like protein